MKYREYRIKSGLTQQELADKLNISKTHISNIENGLKDPSVKLLVHMAAALNTCPCNLLDFPGDCVSLLLLLISISSTID